jgi:hypothetical protein
MTLPEAHLPRRRRQILDDQTGAGHRFNAREHEDGWANGDSPVPGDAWVKNFVARLAALIHHFGGKN